MYLPLHLGFTHWCAESRYFCKLAGTSRGSSYCILFSLIRRPDNSLSDGGSNDMSLTKRTTNGFDLKLNCCKLRSFINSTGRVWKFLNVCYNLELKHHNMCTLRRLLCKLNDSKLLRKATVDGNVSSWLSLSVREIRFFSFPMVAGMSVSWLPPKYKVSRLK